MTINLTIQQVMTTMNVLRAFASQQNAATMRAVADVLEPIELSVEQWQKENSPVQIVMEDEAPKEDEQPAVSDNHQREELAEVTPASS